MENIEAKAIFLGIDSATAAREVVLSHLRSLAQKDDKGHNCFRYIALSYSSYLHSIVLYRQLATKVIIVFSEYEEFADIMEYLVERKVLIGTELEENLLREPLFFSLPLPAIWKMSHARVISLEQVIKRWAKVIWAFQLYL